MRYRIAIKGVVVVFLLTSCGSKSPIGGSNGRVSGRALAGPTCPVEQPGDTNCEPKPVQGTIQFTQDGDVVSTVRINAGGDFTVEVPVGIYTVKVDIGDSIFPLCTPVEVEVRANAESVVEILCDTGIR